MLTEAVAATRFNIDEMLNQVNYSPEPGYVPSDFAMEMVTFIKLVNGEEGEEHETPLFHYRMLDTVATGAKKGRIANLCYRGSAKTTLFAEYLFLYLAVYGELPNFGSVDLAIYVSDSIDNGVKNLRKNLEYRYENSDFLKQYVPYVRFTDIRYEFKNADGKTFIVKAYGAQTGVRGTKEMGKRPQLAILDDLLSDEDARSDTIIASVENTVYKAVDYALHPSRKLIIWSGTPFNAKDPLYKAVESGAWETNVFPVCEKFPCSVDEFRAAWPDRFTFEYVENEYQDKKLLGKLDTFDQELMLRIMSAEDRLVPDNCILWYELRNLLDNRNNFNFYITTDFATSKKEASDYSVISVWAHSSNADWFWVDGICERQTMDRNINDLFTLVQQWNPQSVGLEVSGQQSGYVQWLQSEMMSRNIFFNLASDKNANEPGIKPNTDKMQRFTLVSAWFKAFKMFFPIEKRNTPVLEEAMNELRLVSQSGMRSKHDDFLDTISMLASMSAWKPNAETDLYRKESEYDSIYQIGQDEYDYNQSAYDTYIV